MMTVKQLREALATMPDDLPVIISSDCWQWGIDLEDAPKLAQYTGDPVGTPVTLERLKIEAEFMNDDYIERHSKPCVVIGYVNV
jgi:hypothetical protein